MKKISLIFLLLFIGLMGFADTYEVIVLKGKLTDRSQSQPVEVLLLNNEIVVTFLDCLENLTVVVETEKGMTIYSQTVNSCETKSIFNKQSKSAFGMV
jgi:hypothetical protein